MRVRFLFSVLVMVLIGGCSQPESPLAKLPLKKKAAKPDPSKIVGTEVGNIMPTYMTKKLDGSQFVLADLRGRVVLLNVWATWCGPCRAETPTLNDLQATYGDKGFKVVGVSVDESGADNVKEFVATEHVRYDIAHDPEQRIANMMQTTVLPTSVVIDKSGHVVWREAGLITKGDASLTKAIETALK